MGMKYREYQPNRGISREDRQRIHPVWRGVGFVLMVLIPIISFAAAEVLLDLNGKNNWAPLPTDLIARPGQFLYDLIPDSMIHIKLILMVVIATALFGLITWISFLIISSFSLKNRSDPYYVPSVRRRRKQL